METEHREIVIHEQDHSEELPLDLKILMIAFSAIIIFVSSDVFTNGPSEKALSTFFLEGFMTPKNFSLLDITVILMSIYFIAYCQLSFRNASPLEKFFFFFAIVCYVLKMANPNNRSGNPVFGLPLFSEIGNYSYLLFFGTIISLPKKFFFKFLKGLLHYSILLVMLRSIILLFLFFVLGQSKSFFFGIRSDLLEQDTLLIFVFFQTITFVLYLIKRDRKYLVVWGALFLVQIFSTRRSPLFAAIVCNAIAFAFYYVRRMPMIGKLITIVCVIFSLFVLPNMISNISPKAKVYVDRYLGAFQTDNVSTDPANSDSGHFEQSLETTKNALKLGFWGSGYGNKLVLEGAFIMDGEYYIHNCFAGVWAFYGVYMTLFYLALALVVLYYFFKELLVSSYSQFNVAVIKLSAITFFLIYMNAMYYTTMNFLVFPKFEYTLTLALCFIFRFSLHDLEELMPHFRLDPEGQFAHRKREFISFNKS